MLEELKDKQILVVGDFIRLFRQGGPCLQAGATFFLSSSASPLFGVEQAPAFRRGSLTLDYYRHLDPLKVSPEAPIVVFSESLTEVRPGGAANA